MIGADLAAYIPQLRAQWESAMTDAAVIERLGPDGAPVATVWAGRVRVQRAAPSAPTTPPGALGFSLAVLDVQAPVDGTDGVRVGDRVTLRAPRRVAYVVDAVSKTHMTHRRITAQHVVGGFAATVYPRASTDRLGDTITRDPYTVSDCVIYGQTSDDPVDASQVTTTRLAILTPPGTPLRSGDEVSASPWLVGRYVIDGDPTAGPLGVTAPLTKLAKRRPA